MTHRDKLPRDLGAIIFASLEGTISPEQQVRLDELLVHDPAARRFYVDFLAVTIGLRLVPSADAAEPDKPEGIPGLILGSAGEGLTRQIKALSETTPKKWQSEKAMKPFESDVFRCVIEQDLHDSATRKAIKATIRKQEKTDERQGRIPGRHQRRKPSRYEVVRGLSKIAAVILFAVLAIWLDRQLWQRVGQSSSPVQPVAKLTDVIGGLSEPGSSGDYSAGDRLYPATFVLEPSGFAELTFDNGTKMVLEGPTRFELIDADKVFLEEGKLFARVSDRASGFTVKGPAVQVIDLGTEFGLQIDNEGTSQVHTYVGKVSFASYDRGRVVEAEIVSAGQARQVANRDGKISEIPLKKQQFVRQVDSLREAVWRGQSLSLADLVGGGNGFGTGRYDASIRMEDGVIVYGRHYDTRRDELAGHFVEVSQSPYIDSIFVPDGEVDPMIVSSRKHYFAECPDTSGRIFEDIFNGPFTGVDPYEDRNSPYQHRLVLEGRSYGTADSPALTVHSNLGITFDLDAIRADWPAFKQVRFTSLCGITQEGRAEMKPTADFWVLVDGKIRFRAVDMRVGTPAGKISIELGPEDRFLSLVCTDGGDKTASGDWGLFAEPRLEVINP